MEEEEEKRRQDKVKQAIEKGDITQLNESGSIEEAERVL